MKLFQIILVLILISVRAFGQPDFVYSILVAGHGYGAHLGKNIGLHPPFLEKLNAIKDTNVMGLFLTGDIVNYSNTSSWKQVESELADMNFDSYYVMGNHDDNTVGHAEFQKKFGSTYYYFVYKTDLFIVLNSTESDRSISPPQLEFLDQVLTNTDSNWKRVFVFFHEVIWNSIEKYQLVRSNSRSRYAQMVLVSNFWQEVFPRFEALPDKKFYLFAGDVGGNPDAIAASYDRWENVTLLSSGMGEVPDENFMKVEILPDTVIFELVALNNNLAMNPITWYNVPEKPAEIVGPASISVTHDSFNYQANNVFNATAYRWNLSVGISGSSDSSAISLHFDPDFQAGKITAIAVNDGFGESEPVELEVVADGNTLSPSENISSEFKIYQVGQNLQIACITGNKTASHLNLYNSLGQLVYHDDFVLNSGLNRKMVYLPVPISGIAIAELTSGNQRITQKIILR
jgi:hypothetical protein